MPEISRFNLQISVVMFENSGTILSFWGRGELPGLDRCLDWNYAVISNVLC